MWVSGLNHSPAKTTTASVVRRFESFHHRHKTHTAKILRNSLLNCEPKECLDFLRILCYNYYIKLNIKMWRARETVSHHPHKVEISGSTPLLRN